MRECVWAKSAADASGPRSFPDRPRESERRSEGVRELESVKMRFRAKRLRLGGENACVRCHNAGHSSRRESSVESDHGGHSSCPSGVQCPGRPFIETTTVPHDRERGNGFARLLEYERVALSQGARECMISYHGRRRDTTLGWPMDEY